MPDRLKPLDSPDKAYFFPNMTDAIFGDEEPRVLIVQVVCVSLIQPIARIRFLRSSAVRWVPFDALASTGVKMLSKLESIERLGASGKLEVSE